MDLDNRETLLEQLPRHRARRRSPLRAQRSPNPNANAARKGPTPDPFTEVRRPVDEEAAAAIADGVRAVAEVADLALTATALLLREIQAKLPPAAGSGRQAKD